MKFAIQIVAGAALLMATEYTVAYYAIGTTHALLGAAASTTSLSAPAGRRHH